MLPKLRLPFLSGVAVATVAGLAACGQATIDTAEVESNVVATFAKQGIALRGISCARAMTCPETVVMPTSDPVRCTLTVGGGARYGVDVTIDDKGKISAVVDDEPAS